MTYRHILLVGGTGMLREATLELAKHATAVTVFARTEPDLRALEQERPGIIHGYPLDYRKEKAVRDALEIAVAARGDIDLAIVWVHEEKAPNAAQWIGGYVQGDFYHVLSSAAADPSTPDDERVARFSRIAGLHYHEVILGFVLEGSHARWLQNAEISKGVLEAIEKNAPRHIVGVVEPWEQRP